MKTTHCKAISQRRPAIAQFEPWLELVGLLSSLLQLVDTFRRVFPKEES